jgi:glutathione-independent formaldehyde dehydrogenase
VKALVYNGPRNVSVSDVPDPRIGRSTDAIVQITRTNICGSDLHMYEGRTNMETGRVLEHDPVEVVMRETNGLGTDRGCECVGYQAHDPQGHEHPNATLNKLVRSVRFTGTIGVVGVYVPADPGGLGELAQHGEVTFGFGRSGSRARRWAPASARSSATAGACAISSTPAKRTRRSSSPTSSRWSAPEGYQHFDSRGKGWTKVTLAP